MQKQLKGNELKTRTDKEFAFTKLMTCGLCGSGISADEKYKKLKNGKFNTHIYYGCSKSKDKNCKCGYINENELIQQLQNLADKVELKESAVLKKMKDEVSRFKKFQLALLGESTVIDVTDKDVKSYVKFILKDGSIEEKRSVLENFTTNLCLENKKVTLSKTTNHTHQHA